MKQETKDMIEQFFKFLGKFLLTHLIWIVPVSVLILCYKPALYPVIILPFLITFVFLSWEKHKKDTKEKEWNVHKLSKPLAAVYYGVILLFLTLTMFATYFGMSKVFALEQDGFWVAAGISFGVPLALFVIILFTKARKTPHFFISACVLYVLFDGLVALPFNFLFFYDHLTKCERVEKSEEYFGTVIDNCDSIIAPKVKQWTSRYESLTDTTFYKDINNQKLSQATSQVTAQTNLIEFSKNQGVYTEEEAKAMKKQVGNTAIKSIGNNTKESKEQTEKGKKEAKDSMDFYNALDTLLIRCKNIQNQIANTSKLDEKIPKVDSIRTLLSDICNGSNSTFLKSKAKSLRAAKQSSINSVKTLYEWIFDIIKGNIKKDMTVIMSFSISVVIDILPLLLSLLFIMYKRND
ncbi:MAG: hypothetical protein LBS01_00880 [Prevotellaceae bacterium]|jgi:hypothetical protein|nr:hypothetical protein [Prevotellaceae bacterium]